MVTTRSGQGSAPATLPSFEELFRRNKKRPLLTDEAKRLRWVLDGSLETAITVLKQPYYDPDTTPEPYCTRQGNELVWHAVAQAPYTEPKVSSVTVSVTEIDDWEDQWRELHLRCTDPPESSDGEDDDDDLPSRMLRRAAPKAAAHDVGHTTLAVKASGGFITVHDYVSAVHPWLLRKYDELLEALAVLDDEPRISLPAGEHLMVTFGGADMLSVGTKEDWLRDKDKDIYLRYAQARVVRDTEYVELRDDDDYGPPPGYSGPWPIPYRGALAVNLEHILSSFRT
jgi:hypothetical protein